MQKVSSQHTQSTQIGGLSKWIVVINRVEARVYDSKDMRKLYVLTNSLGREKNRAFTTNRPFLGRNRSLSKSLTHNLDDEKSPHDEAAKKFAKKICLYLKKRFDEHRFGELLLVAEPRMHGWVEQSLDKKIADRSTWKASDLGHLSDHEMKIRFLGKEAVWPRAVPSQSNS